MAILDGDLAASSLNNVIRNNGGAGWWQSTTISVSTGLTNTTISGNAKGGIYTHADRYYVYVYPWGYGYYFHPFATVSAQNAVVYGNGPPGGAVAAGTSYYRFGRFDGSIVWGNSGFDNRNFSVHYSDIGTGFKSGPGNISADPKLLDPAAGDFRLRHDSPCIDAAPFGFGTEKDFEGEARGSDGNSDGVFQGDMGIDELYPFVAPGAPAFAGLPFHFIAEAPPAEDGHLMLVLLSTGPGGDSGGIVLPGSGGQTVDLAPDILFALGLELLPFLSMTLQSGQGQTAPVIIPPASPRGRVFYAGVSIDLAAGVYSFVTPTHSFLVQ